MGTAKWQKRAIFARGVGGCEMLATSNMPMDAPDIQDVIKVGEKNISVLLLLAPSLNSLPHR